MEKMFFTVIVFLPHTSPKDKMCFNIKLFMVYIEFLVPYYHKPIYSYKKNSWPHIKLIILHSSSGQPLFFSELRRKELCPKLEVCSNDLRSE